MTGANPVRTFTINIFSQAYYVGKPAEVGEISVYEAGKPCEIE